MFLLIAIFQAELSDVIMRCSDEVTIVVLTGWGLWLFLALAGISLHLVLHLSIRRQRLMCMRDRLLREMDEMLDGRRERKPLTVRPKDDLAKELLKRVNKLIERP